jgi:Zn-dependent peptidase ImmA (M78 family)
LHQKQYGVAVLINQQHRRVRRRFSYVHEYAHVLVDRDKRTTPTSKHNESHLIEKRANAFASEFLVPEAGVSEFLDRMNKGATSRELSILYNPATGLADAHESRNDPSAQRITVREVALLAHEYRVSYDVAVYRLSDIGAIRKLQKEELIRDREDGRNLIEILKLYNGETHDAEDQPYLRRQVILLAIESYRRKKITSGRFRDVCCLTNFPADPLLQVAESLMEAEHKDG